MSASIGQIISLPAYSAGLGSGSAADRILGTKRSGPLGIEAIIEYNGLYLNNRNYIDTYLVTNIDGIDDADVRFKSEENPGDDGGTPGFSTYGERTIVLQGQIESKTVWKLRDMSVALREAFADLNTEHPLIFHNIDPTYTLKINCRKSQKLQIPEEQTTLNHFKRTFAIYLRASNPRFLSVDDEYDISMLGSGTTFDAIAFSPHNFGNYTAQPIYTLTGPMTTFALINETNNQMFSLNQAIPSGEKWILDTRNKRFYEMLTGANKFGAFTDFSQRVVFNKGINNIRVTATGLSSLSSVEYRFNHSYL